MNISNAPIMSVIMPVYNSGKYICTAIESILEQSFSTYEFIIVDDGSTDDTIAKIKKFCYDSRIRFFERSHAGYVCQLNFALKKARGVYIARMDSDDVSERTRLEKQFNYLQKNKNISLVGCNVTHINETGKIIRQIKYPESYKQIEQQLPIFSSFCHPSILTYKSVLEKFDGYNIEYEPAEDHFLFLQMLKKKIKMYNIQESLLKYRIHKNSVSSSNSILQNEKSYLSGKAYLLSKIDMADSKKKISKFYFSLGIIEYYRGKMKFARKYFHNSWKLEKGTIIRSMRYYPLSLLGDRIFSVLRKKNILYKINFLLKKIGFDMQFFIFRK